MSNIIEVRNLKKSFKDVHAVNDISFDVHEGQLFAFLGLNGAGKSTTINMICGTLAKDSGTIMVDGISMDEHVLSIKEKIGVVFQNSVLDKMLSVYDNLEIKAGLYGIKGAAFKTRLDELDKLLDLKDLLKRPLGKLSGGQRRRIDIARALLHKPRILILDEPTTGLDPQTRLMVWNCINKLREETKLTVFLTTHYMEEATEADYVVILENGQIVASDTPNELKNKYASDFMRVYTKDKKVIELLKKEKMSFVVKEEYVEIEVDHVNDAKNVLIKYPDVFVDFEILKGKMDDVFLKVTGKQLQGGNNNE